MAKIIIPTPLRKFTNNQSSIETNDKTIRDAIRNLANQHQGLARHLFDENGNIRSFLRIFLGDEDINYLQKETTQLNDDSIISIVPAIAGG